MKIRTYINLFLLLPLFLFTSCEEMVSDVEVPSSIPKLVVSSFITTNLPYTEVRVYKSRPLYTSYNYNDEEFPPVKDAVVTLSNGTTSVTLAYDSVYSTYRVSRALFPIRAGQSYNLNVTAPGGYSISSTCTVPELIPPELEIVSIDTINDNGQVMLNANIRFMDLANVGQFYSASCARIYQDEGTTTPYLYEIGFNRGDPYMTDVNNEGLYFNLETNDIYVNQNEPVRLYFTIAVTDQHYYQYHKNLENYDNDNPFAEPTPIYSNITGGLGIFAGYLQESKSVYVVPSN